MNSETQIKAYCFSSVFASRWPIGALLLFAASTAFGGEFDFSQAEEQKGTISCQGDQATVKKFKPKTITIKNNSGGTIYPIISTSKNAVDEWLQGCFREMSPGSSSQPYHSNYVYKLYVNRGHGIPNGSAVTIQLPVYSALEPGTIPETPRGEIDHITWWNGARVILADKDDRLFNPDKGDNNRDKLIATPNEDNASLLEKKGVLCKKSNTDCKLEVYYSNVQLPENIYAQLSEYTFGDSISMPSSTGKSGPRILKPENVGYNISYVDHVYLPVAIAPKGNPYIGFSGSAKSIDLFRNDLVNFLKNEGKGWPVYNLSGNPAKGEYKLPGGYNIFAQRSGTLPPGDSAPVQDKEIKPVLIVSPCIDGNCSDDEKKMRYGKAVEKLQDLWGTCLDWGGQWDRQNSPSSRYITDGATCGASPELRENMGKIQAFFKANFHEYRKFINNNKCPPSNSALFLKEFTFFDAMTHIYGWVPFNEGCDINLNNLRDTDKFKETESIYIQDIQYNYEKNPTDPLINPYVQLIHKKIETDAYAFSIDDDVGFMSELGGGLIFTVGSAKGLENEIGFNYANGFQVILGIQEKEKDPVLSKYEICGQIGSETKCGTTVNVPPDRQILSFRVGTLPTFRVSDDPTAPHQQVTYPLRVTFFDLNENKYRFTINKPFPTCPKPQPVPNSPSDTWCVQAPENPMKWKVHGVFVFEACEVVNSKNAPHPQSKAWCDGADPHQLKEKRLAKNFLSFPPTLPK